MDFTDSFYKYCTSERALQDILPNSTLRFSHPSKFNDPFDVVPDQLTNFDLDSSWSEFEKLYRDAVRNGDDLIAFREGRVRLESPIHQALLEAHLEDEDLQKHSITVADKVHLNKTSIVNSFNNIYQAIVQDFNRSKVFCASQELDNLLLWAHYAKDHTGLVLEFKPDVESDSAFQLLKEVEYNDKRPTLWNSLNDMVLSSFSVMTATRIEEFVRQCIYTKSTHWRYEKELRMIDYVAEDSDVFDMQFNTNELIGVYFGCRINQLEQKKIEELLKVKYPSVKKYKMKKSNSDYKLDKVNLID